MAETFSIQTLEQAQNLDTYDLGGKVMVREIQATGVGCKMSDRSHRISSSC